MLNAVRKISRAISSAGFTCQMVGGAVRDMLRGREPDDIDLVTTARPDELEKIFPDIRWAGRAFGVSLLKVDGFTFELASARKERSYLDGRHPEEIEFSRSLEDDVIRRDFTVNALLCDPETFEVTDYVGGVQDVKNAVIRTVGVPEERFAEDALRMLRAVRFAAKTGFRIDGATFAAIKKLAANVRLLAQERVKCELDNIFISSRRGEALDTLLHSGLLKHVLPEVADLKGVVQEKRFHPEGDVYTHTKIMLDMMVYPDPVLAWSILLHDTGKKYTTFTDRDGRIRAFGHEERGAKIASQVAERLRFSVSDRDTVVKAVRDHMRMANVREMKLAKLKKLLSAPGFPLELELHRLDCMSSHKMMECWLYMVDKVNEIPQDQLAPAPFVTGRELIALGGKPGPHFKKILDALYDAQLAGKYPSSACALADAEKMLEKMR